MARFVLRALVVASVVFSIAKANAQPTAVPLPPPAADSLTAGVHMEDADRFARLFAETSGKPTADQLQEAYIAPGSYGIAVFTPYRIVSASHLAEAVAKHQTDYAHAIQVCLPQVKAADADLRSIYLGLHGLLPDQPLPQIYMVFGAGNSGGTEGPGAQVLGLEVLCAAGDTPAAFRATLRRFFAHETVHVFQHEPVKADMSPLLSQALIEGAADFIAMTVTGDTPVPERAKWAALRERELWVQFRADMEAAKPLAQAKPPASAKAAFHRWIANYQNAPPGWPYEAGYWVGMRIWQAYYERAADKHQAIRDMLNWDDPEDILQKSGYSPN